MSRSLDRHDDADVGQVLRACSDRLRGEVERSIVLLDELVDVELLISLILSLEAKITYLSIKLIQSH